MQNVKRVPIAPDVTEDDVAQVAYFENLDNHDYIEGDEKTPTETVYNVPGEETFLHYIEDEMLGISYIAFSGENAENLEKKVADKVKTVKPADVARALKSPPKDPEKLRRTLAHAFLLAPPKHDETFDKYFRIGFEHADPDVRRQAVVGVGYVGWPELAEPLRELAENDPDTDVKRDAKAMLKALKGAK
ncbi:MAG TPA: HEAT repeat domain-containing protein [Thermoanaerobaculia bacterium]|nr:HEAT repeat domain-containing protein [Thermoanaerobaculia bacterium]